MRTFDSERINYLINHETIRPTCGGDITQPIDFTPLVKDRQNIFLDGEYGGLAFIWSAPSIYEVHVYLLPEGRGPWGFDFAMRARDYMGSHARMLWARVNNPALRYFTMKAGFTACGQHAIDIGQGPITYDLYKWEY